MDMYVKIAGCNNIKLKTSISCDQIYTSFGNLEITQNIQNPKYFFGPT